MSAQGTRPLSGHVFRVERKRGPAWYAKYRLADGRQAQKRLGPAWTQRGRPEAGYFTKRTAEDWLRDVLDQARRGTLPGAVRTGARFEDAAAEFLRYVEQDRACKPTTVQDYRNMVRVLERSFGGLRVEEITPQIIEQWKGEVVAERGISNRTLQKYLVTLHGIFKRAMRVHGLLRNPADSTSVERPRIPRGTSIDALDYDEVMTLARAAASEQEAALYVTAALTGLRVGELCALRWADVDFALEQVHVRRNFTASREGTPKSGSGRQVPLMEEVARTLAQLGQRERFVSESDLVFCSALGEHLGYKGVHDRYVAARASAGLRSRRDGQPFRFHDLRHTFGSVAIRTADVREVMEWMGHADLATTQKYLAYRPRADAARRLSRAFREPGAANPSSAVEEEEEEVASQP